MNKEEKKEYLNNIFQLVLSGEENFELADSLIESLNLHDDFVNHAEKEIKVLRAKKSFIESNSVFTAVEVWENIGKAAEIGSDLIIVKSFLSDIENKKPQHNEGA